MVRGPTQPFFSLSSTLISPHSLEPCICLDLVSLRVMHHHPRSQMTLLNLVPHVVEWSPLVCLMCGDHNLLSVSEVVTLCIHDSCVYYDMNEINNEMIRSICFDFKPWGPHLFIYVMCIGILLHYVMLVRMHTFDTYVRHDIMRAFSSVVSDNACREVVYENEGFA